MGITDYGKFWLKVLATQYSLRKVVERKNSEAAHIPDLLVCVSSLNNEAR